MAAVGPEDVRSSNVSEFEAREFSVDKLAAAAMVVPFLADRRAVVVRGLMGTAEGGQHRGGRRGQDNAQSRPPPELATLLGELPPTSDVIFFEGKVSPANPFLKAVAGAANGQARCASSPRCGGTRSPRGCRSARRRRAARSTAARRRCSRSR